MDIFEAMQTRRSIRRFKSDALPEEVLRQILQAGMVAPSAKNLQPWKFIVVTEKDKPGMLAAMREGIDREKAGEGMFTMPPSLLQGAEYTMAAMAKAPVTVFVLNTGQSHFDIEANSVQQLMDATNIQSVGAAIQNMLLAATALGIGSLWICDVFFAYRSLCAWLGESGQMLAAVTLGYPDESPNPRPRKQLEDVVVWR